MTPLESRDRNIRRLAIGAALAAVSVVVATVGAMFIVDARHANAAATPSYVAGDTIDVPAEFYTGQPSTVLIFASGSCGACLRARPVLASLVAALQDTAAKAVMVTGTEQPRAQDEYARAILVDPAHVRRAPLSGLRVRVVPTVVVVDEGGAVLYAHEGLPDDAVKSHAVEAARRAGAVRG
jgi:hypothetical protein